MSESTAVQKLQVRLAEAEAEVEALNTAIADARQNAPKTTDVESVRFPN